MAVRVDRLWRDARLRGFAFQALALAGVIALGWYLVHNAATNLALQQRPFGFGFLADTASFSVPQTLIAYDESSTYGRVLLVGLLNTLLVSVLGIVLATLLGFVIGVGRLAPNPLVRGLCGAYVEILRNVPILLQILFWYFAVIPILPPVQQSVDLGFGLVLNNRGLFVPRITPQEGAWLVFATLGLAAAAGLVWARIARRHQERTGVRRPVLWPVLGGGALAAVAVTWMQGVPFSAEFPVPPPPGFAVRGGIQMLPELVALVAALSTYIAAFIAEIVRAGILGVPKGQTEAALALGLSRGQVLRLVVIPQALRIIIPPLTSQYLNLTKGSSLAVAVAYPDLVQVFARISLSQTGRAIEIIAITMAVYLAISLLTALAMGLYNARIKRAER